MQRAARVFAQARFAFWIQAATSNARFRSMRRIENCDAVIRVYDEAGNVIETHEHAKDNVVTFRADQVVSSFTHVVLCPAGPPKVHMGKVSPTLIDITLGVCVWQ